MASCSNCDREFERRKDRKGYYRFSLENITASGQQAREELANLTGSFFTPVSNKRQGQFLCPTCWTKLNDTVKYKISLHELWGHTSSKTYIGMKRQSASTSARKDSPKKARYTSTPLKRSKSSKTLFTSKAKQASKWEKIISNVRARQYGRAIKGLMNATKGSKKQFIKVVKDEVRKEMLSILKPNTKCPLSGEVSIPTIEDFSWETTLGHLETTAPLFFNVVRSVVTKKSNEQTLMSGTNLKPKLGTAISCLLHARAPRKASFLQTLFSVQFWRGNLKREMIDQLSKMGICVGYKRTLGAIDNIRKDFDAAALLCKSETERQLTQDHDASMADLEDDMELSRIVADTAPNIEDEVNSPTDSEATISYDPELYIADVAGESETEVSEDFESEEEGGDSLSEDEEDESMTSGDDSNPSDNSIAQAPLQPGFTMCWDNVGKKVTSRHPGIDSSNKYINMALGYMAINRVSSTHLDWQFHDGLTKATDMPNEAFLPSQEDFKSLKRRMSVIVGRIISRHLSWFRTSFHDLSIPHILHEDTAPSSRRSVLVNLGVFDVDPSSTQGAISIYETLQRYVPSINEKPYTTLVYGDGLSCERGNDAHKARSNGLNPWERLEGCQPAAQEFHKEMLLLQDFYDLFFKGSSAADRGTLSHLKNLFNFRQVKSDVSDNFTHAWELMCVATEGLVCLAVMKYLEMVDENSRPKNAPDSIEEASSEERLEYFEGICSDIVQKLWHVLNVNALNEDDGTGPPVFCCGEDFEDDTIACNAGSLCENGEVFHYMCADIDPDNLPQDWYCSDECRNRVSVYSYCNCQTDLGNDEPMIGCSAGDMCTRKEWYHMKCVDIRPDNIPKGNWFCCNACKTVKKSRKKGPKKASKSQDTDTTGSDHKYNYARAMTWIGLNLLCRRDAVREADGEAMIAHWKFDLVHFFRSKHPKYLILAHRLLACINGWLPEKLRYDLIHNRTVNYGGGIGRNLPMDFVNEILNRLFKDLLDSAKGRYTNTTIQRCGQIIGPLGEALDSVFESQVIQNELYRHRRRSENRDKNVEQVISLFNKEDFFSFHPGRHHRAFPNFTHSPNPINSGQFKAKMLQLSKKIDKRRRIILNNNEG